MTFLSIILLAATTLVSEPSRLLVRIYDTSEQGAVELASAQDAAALILDGGGIEVTWLLCSAIDPRSACAEPLGPMEIAVRLIRGSVAADRLRSLRLGDSLVDTSGHGGSLATVYVDRVEWLASQTDADPRVLLGRTIAHEVGHLLLGTNRHGSTGIMRALWSGGELRRNRADDWRFTLQDRIELRQAIAGKRNRPE